VQKKLLGLVVLLVALLAPATAQAGSKTFTDPSGDSGNAADVTRVVVLNTRANEVAIGLTLANRPQWQGTRSVVALAVDTDRNGATGKDGIDFWVYMVGSSNGIEVYRWNGTDYAQGSADGFRGSFDKGILILEMTPAARAGGNSFDFYAVSFEEDESDESTDSVPDGDAIWTYELTPPVVETGFATFAPKAPRAGATFAVSRMVLEYDDGSQVTTRSYTCRATLGGKVLKPTGRCKWKLPKNAKGKRLVVTVTAAGGTFQPWRFTVR
jgi:hypothetical protein